MKRKIAQVIGTNGPEYPVCGTLRRRLERVKRLPERQPVLLVAVTVALVLFPVSALAENGDIAPGTWEVFERESARTWELATSRPFTSRSTMRTVIRTDRGEEHYGYNTVLRKSGDLLVSLSEPVVSSFEGKPVEPSALGRNSRYEFDLSRHSRSNE